MTDDPYDAVLRQQFDDLGLDPDLAIADNTAVESDPGDQDAGSDDVNEEQSTGDSSGDTDGNDGSHNNDAAAGDDDNGGSSGDNAPPPGYVEESRFKTVRRAERKRRREAEKLAAEAERLRSELDELKQTASAKGADDAEDDGGLSIPAETLEQIRETYGGDAIAEAIEQQAKTLAELKRELSDSSRDSEASNSQHDASDGAGNGTDAVLNEIAEFVDESDLGDWRDDAAEGADGAMWELAKQVEAELQKDPQYANMQDVKSFYSAVIEKTKERAANKAAQIIEQTATDTEASISSSAGGSDGATVGWVDKMLSLAVNDPAQYEALVSKATPAKRRELFDAIDNL